MIVLIMTIEKFDAKRMLTECLCGIKKVSHPVGGETFLLFERIVLIRKFLNLDVVNQGF